MAIQYIMYSYNISQSMEEIVWGEMLLKLLASNSNHFEYDSQRLHE